VATGIWLLIGATPLLAWGQATSSPGSSNQAPYTLRDSPTQDCVLGYLSRPYGTDRDLPDNCIQASVLGMRFSPVSREPQPATF